MEEFLPEATPCTGARNYCGGQVEVTYQPGASSSAHSHPCPVLAYVAEGTIRSQVNDEPERVYKVGETFYEAPNGVHRVSANASQTEPAKLIAFFSVRPRRADHRPDSCFETYER